MHEAAAYEPSSDRLKCFGVKDICPIWSMLPYTSFNNLHTLPTFHMLLHGVLRKTWSMLLATTTYKVLTGRQVSKMRQREPGIILTDDFNNQYSDITKQWSSWKLYDWLTWADVWSVCILDGIEFNAVMP